jgi:pyruvate-ferredoxin/flavodoxin oxidoreductase
VLGFQDLEEALDPKVLQRLAALQPQLYLVDARAVAEAAGLGERINMVMQTVFFHLSGVLPMEKVRERVAALVFIVF